MKVVVVGDEGVGKQSLIEKEETFEKFYYQTHGFQPYFVIRTVEDREVRFQNWILNPKEEFNEVRKSYYIGALGAIVVFDTSVKSTFNSIDRWIHEVWEGAGNFIPIIIMGNRPIGVSEDIEMTNRVYEYVRGLMIKEKEGIITLKYVENSLSDKAGFEDTLTHLGIEYFYLLEKRKQMELKLQKSP